MNVFRCLYYFLRSTSISSIFILDFYFLFQRCGYELKLLVSSVTISILKRVSFDSSAFLPLFFFKPKSLLELKNPPENTFSQLLIADPKAFENLFHEYYDSLCSYAFHFLKEQAGAEEIVQDIFFTLWQKRESLDIKVSLKAYLYQATKNRCLNLIKHIEIRENYKTHNQNVRDERELSLENTMEEMELNTIIQEAISSLPKERQKIFRLSRFEDLKYKEIAEELNISIKTVENQMSKALKFLREQLSEYLPILGFALLLWIKKYL